MQKQSESKQENQTSVPEEQKQSSPNRLPEQVVTQDKVYSGVDYKPIDYNKLIDSFGCTKINPDLLIRIEKLTGKKPHHLLTRDIFFSHRDLEFILDNYEKGKPFFLYTGRGPSSESMHLGHLLPFTLTKYLQDAFKVPVIIQITDDEKFFFRGEYSLEQYSKHGIENIKDILALGFDPELTFVFMDTEYMGGPFYHNVCKIQKAITFNQLKGIFGITESDNCGKVAYPAIQAAPCFSNSFPHIFGNRTNVPCLVPQGIDQDPYFRMTRDIAAKLKYPKPACIHNKFFPSILGAHEKMSASSAQSTIYLTDTAEKIETKITKYAFSGGAQTLEEHRAKGANLEIDVPYQYLIFFLEDEEKLADIREKYSKGIMLTSEVKAILIKVLQDLIGEYQVQRAKITTEMVREYTKIRPIKVPIPPNRVEEKNGAVESQTEAKVEKPEIKKELEAITEVK